MKKHKMIISVIAVAVAVIIIPLSLIITAAALPKAYTDSYYAELGEMYDKLKRTEGKKIVIIGNSNVAFGVYSEYLEMMLKESGEEYTVCNFGLYGAIGTKTMLDLSKKYIGKDDIVIFTPEPYFQTCSLYFSAMDTWRSSEGNLKMLGDINRENMSSLVGNFPGYVAEKYRLTSTASSLATGVYAKASFDENCDMTVAERYYNVFPDGYDINNKVTLNDDLLDKSFINYVNDYYTTINKKGAKMYYSFCPVNRLSLTNTDEEVDSFWNLLNSVYSFPVLGNPHSYVMDSEWFYDTNFHLNMSGMYVRTIQLYSDLIFSVFDKIPKYYSLPEKPQPPEIDISSGDNTDVGCFTYEFDGDRQGYKIVGLTDEGLKKSELIIPVTFEGKPVIDYSASTFKNCKTLTKLTVQKNIPMLYNNSFDGCTALTKIVLKQTNPNKIATGYSVLGGTANCRFYVDKDSVAAFYGHYTWGHLSKYILPNTQGEV